MTSINRIGAKVRDAEGAARRDAVTPGAYDGRDGAGPAGTRSTRARALASSEARDAERRRLADDRR